MRGNNFQYTHQPQYFQPYDESSNHSSYSYEAQSGLSGTTLSVSGRTNAQTTVFQDGEEVPVYQVDGQYPDSSYIAPTPDTSLSEFFSRPVLINTQAWSVGTGYDAFGAPLDVWDLFLTNKRVANRISNIALLRARVHLKFTVNGNGFYYGRAMASVLPLAATDQLSKYELQSDYVQLSQLPHVFINPTTCMGGEISIPFFSNTDYYDISGNYQNSTIGAKGRLKLFLRQLNFLQSANGSVAPLEINTFMWLSEVETSNITIVNPQFLSAQSGDEIDVANQTGAVSGPATAVANAASALSGIPIIKPYAMVAEKMAVGTARIAKAMGMSRPNMTVQPTPLRMFTNSSLALTTVPDLSQKLTLDDKQSMSIDPRLAGVSPEDPLDIVAIAKRETLFRQFSWSVADTDQIFSVAVQPHVWLYEPSIGSHHLAATAAATLPFEYWGGTLRYRFQVVCSAHHKGRLAIAWDPNYLPGVLSMYEYNVNYIRVVDIADTTDFSIDVGWGQTTPFVERYKIGTDDIIGTTTTFFPSKPKGNGVLSVRVLNDLTRPNPDFGAAIYVNVFISATDDFRVACPTNDMLSMGYSAQSGSEQQTEGSKTIEQDMPQRDLAHLMGTDYVPDHIYSTYMGETITSMRMLIKRYSRWRVENMNETAGAINNINLPYWPFSKGEFGPDPSVTYATNGYGRANMTYLTLIAPCYAAIRGSIRWKIHMDEQFNSASRPSSVVHVSRLRRGIGYKRTAGTGLPGPTTLPEAGVTLTGVENLGTMTYPSGCTGMYVGSLTNTMAEVELPFYSRYKFTTARDLAWYVLNSSLSPDINGLNINFVSQTANMSFYLAAGDDFQCYWWLGMPRLFYKDTLTP